MRVIAMPISANASAAAAIVQTSRTAGVTFFVRSSISPEAKAGSPHAASPRMPPAIAGYRRDSSAVATTSPIRMPVPPTRGTGRAWNFCTPARSLSIENRSCRCA